MKYFLSLIVVCLFCLANTASAQERSIDSSPGNDFTLGSEEPSFFEVYPNPSKGSIQLRILSAQIDQFKLVIYDMHGATVFEKVFTGLFEGLNMDLKLKKPGLYFLKIQTDSNQYVERIVVKP